MELVPGKGSLEQAGRRCPATHASEVPVAFHCADSLSGAAALMEM